MQVDILITKDEGRRTKDDKRIQSARDLDVYKLAFEAAMEIFKLTKSFPVEERYSLIDQIRRSSRSVCANLAEGWRKRYYKAVFIQRILDASQEAAETQTWLEFSYHCGYFKKEIYSELFERYEHIYAMLSTMERKADTFCK